MKNIRKNILTFAGLLLLASPLMRAAEPALPPPPDGPPPHERGDDMRDGMKKRMDELNLSAEQKVKVDAIFKETADATRALRDNADLSKAEKLKKGRELRKANEDKINAVLTPEQRVQADEMRKNREGRGKGRPDKN